MRERQRLLRHSSRGERCERQIPVPFIPAHYVEMYDFQNQRSVWVDPAELSRHNSRPISFRNDCAFRFVHRPRRPLQVISRSHRFRLRVLRIPYPKTSGHPASRRPDSLGQVGTDVDCRLNDREPAKSNRLFDVRMLLAYLPQHSGHFPKWAAYVAPLNTTQNNTTPTTASVFFIHTSPPESYPHSQD